MKLKLASLQAGPFEKSDTYDSYINKQWEVFDKLVAAEKPDAVLFPEVTNGPYFCQVYNDAFFEMAETVDGPTITTSIQKAKESNTHIVSSIFFKDSDNRYYDICFFCSPTRGLVGIYRKCHIPKLETPTLTTDESYYFDEGNELSTFSMDNGVRIAMMLCYDRSFPECWRTYYLKGAQIFFVSACTWGFRGDFFINELRTRAFETHSFLVVANRAGDEIIEGEKKARDHFGKSAIIDPMGEVIAIVEKVPFSYVAAEVDLDLIAKVNAPLPWKRDRRPELYGIITSSKREGFEAKIKSRLQSMACKGE